MNKVTYTGLREDVVHCVVMKGLWREEMTNVILCCVLNSRSRDFAAERSHMIG